jgi:hypothetical protein
VLSRKEEKKHFPPLQGRHRPGLLHKRQLLRLAGKIERLPLIKISNGDNRLHPLRDKGKTELRRKASHLIRIGLDNHSLRNKGAALTLARPVVLKVVVIAAKNLLRHPKERRSLSALPRL